MKKYLLLSFLIVGFLPLIAWQPKDSGKNSFLDEAARKRLADADSIVVTDIFSMNHTPHNIAPDDYGAKFSRTLDAGQAERLKQYLFSASQMDPQERMSQCSYQPGLKLKASKKDAPDLTLLICLNCDLWAVGSDGAATAEKPIAGYGDLRPYRAEVVKLMKELFPGRFPTLQ